MKVKLDAGAFPPTKAHGTDGGWDLRTPKDFTVPAHGSAVIDTGVHMALPSGTVGFLKSKSGLNVKHGITNEGVIDYGYTGSIVVKLYNHSDKEMLFWRGEKITQIVILYVCMDKEIELVEDADELYNGATDRGENGFGSSGK